MNRNFAIFGFGLGIGFGGIIGSLFTNANNAHVYIIGMFILFAIAFKE
jgi:hypothetical protein